MALKQRSVLGDPAGGVIGAVVLRGSGVVPRAVPTIAVHRHMLRLTDRAIGTGNAVDALSLWDLTCRPSLVDRSFIGFWVHWLLQGTRYRRLTMCSL